MYMYDVYESIFSCNILVHLDENDLYYFLKIYLF